MKEDHRFGSTIRGKVRRPPEEQYLREILHGFEVLGGWVARLSRWQKTIAGDATAINYNLWPWVGRASEPPQNQGFTRPFLERFLARGSVRAVLSPILDVGSGGSLRPKREELLKAARRRELDRIVVWRLDRWER